MDRYDEINAVDNLAISAEVLFKKLQKTDGPINGRWLSIGRTHFQEGFAALRRALDGSDGEDF